MILAIDPGSVQSAFCLIDETDGRPIRFAKAQNQDVLDGVAGMSAGCVVIERVASYGQAVGRDVFETCEWVGRFTEAAVRSGKTVHYIYRREEKSALCGRMNARDADIRRALIERFAAFDLQNGKGTKKRPDWFYGFAADVWQAYAVGVTWMDKEGKHEQSA